jgi:serine/threonine-protein kinase
MFVLCSCGTRNSAFNPRCTACGRPIVERKSEAPGPLKSERELAPGDRAGGYVLESLLGRGSVGRVFRARRVGDGTAVAIKVLHPHVVQSRDARGRFLREATAMTSVRHRCVGRIFEVFDVGGLPALALELYSGASLRRLMETRGKLIPEHAIPLLIELVEALGAIHEAGWVHRDLKPENVMLLDPEAEAPRDLRLLDFGLVRSLGTATDTVRTAAGAFVGSPAYASPEQILGEEITAASDWWSLGVVAYELLTGKRPFDGASRSAICRSVLGDEPASFDVGPRLTELVRGLLTKDPEGRPARKSDVLDALRGA